MTKIIKQNVSLKKYTTFKIGGSAKFFAEPADIDELQTCLKFVADNNLKYYFLGAGANTLASDDGFDGLVIHTSRLSSISVDGTSITAECGATVDDLTNVAIDNSLSGLEFAYGLPGSVGGATYMNARCYGAQFSDVIESVDAVECRSGKVVTLSNKEMNFSYKHSIFTDNEDLFILRVKFCLVAGECSIIKENSEKNKNDRKAKGQYDFPSAGCIFKNNYEIGIPAGKLIEDAGLKGTQIGGAKIFDKHANFIINADNATASDVVALITLVENTLAKKNFRLEKEVKIIGNNDG